MKYSVYDWCIKYNRNDILDRWDYDLNSINPSDVSIYSKDFFYLKCPENLHKSSKYIIATLAKHNSPLECKYCNSFEHWCIKNNRQDLLDRWDYDLNDSIPEETARTSPQYYYFKCPRGLHKSTSYKLNNLTKYSYSTAKCSFCNSFAQWGIDNLGDDFLEKYWDYDKNIGLDPWSIPFRARPTSSFYIKCQYNSNHESYKTFPDHFVGGARCPECARTKTESFLEEQVRKYLQNNYDYDLKHEYNCSIVDYNYDSKHCMPYDNDLKIGNSHLIIEVHGKQHYEICQYTVLYAERAGISPEEALALQKNRDKHKKEYVLSLPNYYYLDLSYKVIKNGSFMRIIDDKISYINSLNKNSQKEEFTNAG